MITSTFISIVQYFVALWQHSVSTTHLSNLQRKKENEATDTVYIISCRAKVAYESFYEISKQFWMIYTRLEYIKVVFSLISFFK